MITLTPDQIETLDTLAENTFGDFNELKSALGDSNSLIKVLTFPDKPILVNAWDCYIDLTSLKKSRNSDVIILDKNFNKVVNFSYRYMPLEIESLPIEDRPPIEEWPPQLFGSLLIDGLIVENLEHYLWLYEQAHGSIFYLTFKTDNNINKILMLIVCTKFPQKTIDHLIKLWQQHITYKRQELDYYEQSNNQVYLNFNGERLVRVYKFEHLTYSNNLNLIELIENSNSSAYVEFLANNTISLSVQRKGAYAIGLFDLVDSNKVYWYRLENYMGEGRLIYKYTNGLNFFIDYNQILNTPVIDIGLNLNNRSYSNNKFTLYADLVLDSSVQSLVI